MAIVERPQFADPDTKYHSYHAAQHVVRYAVARGLVKGKRVLDVACGEGYGSKLLRQWGAREVVGIDIFPKAIANAKKNFGGKSISFLVGDAENLGNTLQDVETFDVIISLETIEHLARPDLFLAVLSNFITQNGVIIISCPNDHAFQRSQEKNKYHMYKYTLADLQNLTEKYLGKASQWLLGAPLLGEMNFTPGDKFVEVPDENPRAIIRNKIVENALLIPSKYNLVTSAETCSHYIGIWGTTVAENVVISALSVSEYQGIWKHSAFLESEVNKLTMERDALLARISTDLKPQLSQYLERARQAEEQINALKEECTELARRGGQLEAQATEDHVQIARLTESVSVLTAQQKELKVLLSKLEKEKTERLEPEIARLRSHVEHSRFEKETQVLRRRLMHYAENDRRLTDQIAEIWKRLSEEQKLRENWYVPELARLHAYRDGAIDQMRRALAKEMGRVVSALLDSSVWRFLPDHRRVILQMKLLRRSGLFDSEWYINQYKDVAKAGVDPLVHYVLHGANEGREPNRTLADLKKAFTDGS